MAGRPMRRRMLIELDRRAQEYRNEHELGAEFTSLDYVCEWVAGGATMRDLIRDMNTTAELGMDVGSGLLSSWVNSSKEGKVKMAEARAIASHILAEDGMDILDEADEDRDALTKAKARSDYRRWLASVWNPKQYGNQQPQLAVNVNLAQLHIEAMRKREIPTVASVPVLPPNGPDYEVVSDG